MPRIITALLTAIIMAFTLNPGSVCAAPPLFTIVFGDGAAQRTVAVDDDMLQQIAAKEIYTKVVSLNSDVRSVRGVLARDLLKHVGATGTMATISALDDYQIEIPLGDFTQYDVVIAVEIDGKRLTVRDKGPAWVIYPVSSHPELDHQVYESRSVWQIKTIEIK